MLRKDGASDGVANCSPATRTGERACKLARGREGLASSRLFPVSPFENSSVPLRSKAVSNGPDDQGDNREDEASEEEAGLISRPLLRCQPQRPSFQQSAAERTPRRSAIISGWPPRKASSREGRRCGGRTWWRPGHSQLAARPLKSQPKRSHPVSRSAQWPDLIYPLSTNTS